MDHKHGATQFSTIVKQEYFMSIKFLQFLRLEYNHEIKYTQISGIAPHHKFIRIEYQHLTGKSAIFYSISPAFPDYVTFKSLLSQIHRPSVGL